MADSKENSKEYKEDSSKEGSPKVSTPASSSSSKSSKEDLNKESSRERENGGRGGDDHEACYTKGTLIATDKGERLIEDLVPGDLLLTISGEYVPLKWVGHRTVDCENHSKPTNAWPIRIAQGAFGNNLPKRDLYLSPLHSVYVDNIFIPVVDLVNDLTITQEPTAEITYYHLELPAHNVIFAEGLAAESYLDDNNRGFFIGSDSDPVNLIAEFAEKKTSEAIWQQQGFAKVMRSGSPEVEKIKADLLTCAEELLNNKLAA